MPALEPVDAVRVVGTAAALDAARWTGDGVDVIRIAPDEALGVGATGVEVDDPDAIIEPETGFSVALLSEDDEHGVIDHIEWALERGSGIVAQGKVAGVPAKLVGGRPSVLVVQTAYAGELRERLGW